MKKNFVAVSIALAALAAATQAFAQSDPIITQSTSDSRSINESTTTVKSPPPTAISPAITTINSDVCAVGFGGAAQTQILGISFGSTRTDYNCERLKLSKTLFDMGMKVAAVATLCQDRRVWDSMMAAGTPCPIDGKIGAEARELWEANPARIPVKVVEK